MKYACRTCLSFDEDDMKSVFTVECVNGDNISISEMISLCTGLEISKHDNFTNVICNSCTITLIVAFNYRQTCWNSHISLLQYTSEPKNTIEQNENLIEFVNCMTDEVIEMEEKNDIVTVQTLSNNEIVESNKPAVSLEPNEVSLELPIEEVIVNQSQKLSDHVEIILDKTCYLGKRYICRTCKHYFIRRDKIVTHLRIAHDIIISIPNGNNCNICFKIFQNPCSLRKHIETVHNPDSFVCDLCGATLKSKETFEQHLRRHTGEKPFKCKFCDYRSAHNTSIIYHRRLVHTGETPFLCNFCGESFISASRRSNHMTIHMEPKFECIVCKKQFKSRNQYKKHMIIHDLTKYVPCDVCGQKFAKRSNMMTHRKQHTGEKNHTCKECGKGFIQRHCWRTHMKNYHNQTVV